MTDEGRGTPYITCIDLDHDDICRHESDVIRLIERISGIYHSLYIIPILTTNLLYFYTNEIFLQIASPNKSKCFCET